MSRSRSRAEKGKPPSSIPSPSIRTAFPEKITGADWNAFLDADESQDVAHQLCSELLDQTLTKIFDLYIQKQVIPYTVSQIEGALLQLLEMEFFDPDASEPVIEGSKSWLQDEVAQACPIDSWAQGAISKRSETVWWDKEDTDSPQTDTLEASNQDSTARKLSSKTLEQKQPQKKISETLQKKLNTTNIQNKSPKANRKTSNVENSVHTTVRSRREAKPNQQPTTTELSPRGTQNQKESDQDKKKEEQHRLEEERAKRETSLTKQFIQQKAFASGRFVFDDEGNLLSVPNITKPINQPTGTRKSRKTNSYFDRMVAIKCDITSADDLQAANSVSRRSVPLKATGKATRVVNQQPRIQEAERVRLVKTSDGLRSIGDLIKLTPGVSISEGDKLRTGCDSLAGPMTAGDRRLQNLIQIPCLQERTSPPEPLIELCPIRIVSQQ